MATLFYAGLFYLLSLLLCFALKRRAAFTDITIYEVTDGMLPVDRELLLEIEKESGPVPASFRNAHDYRRRVRTDLEYLKDQFHWILRNSQRSRYWAYSDWRVIEKHRLEHPPEVLEATDRVLDAERQLRRMVRRRLFRIWLWSITGFHRRHWGPVPGIHNLDILKIVEAYEQVRLAAVNLARCYGAAATAEEIARCM